MKLLLFSSFLVAVALCAPAAEYSGRVYDKLDRPIPGPKVCWQMDTSRCVFGNDSGTFHIAFQSAIREATPKISFRAEFSGGKISILSSSLQYLTLEWFDANGDLLSRSGFLAQAGIVTMPENPGLKGHVGAGLILLRISGDRVSSIYRVVCLPGASASPVANFHPTALGKVASAPLPRVIVIKSGYRKTEAPLYDGPDPNWITMARIGDTGYYRTESYRLRVTAVDSVAHVIRTLGHSVRCDSSRRLTEEFPGNLPYAFANGKLFLITTGCQGFQLSGGGGVIGNWKLEDQAAELPAAIRPDSCPPPSPGSRPVDSPTTAEIRIGKTEMEWFTFAEQCPGSELYSNLSNYFRPDSGVHMIEKSCKRVAFRNRLGEEAAAIYTPYGGQESTLVSFEYNGKKCAYIDPLYNSDPPPTCPDPAEMASQNFISCVGATGFATPKKPLAKGSAPTVSGNPFSIEFSLLLSLKRTLRIGGE